METKKVTPNFQKVEDELNALESGFYNVAETIKTFRTYRLSLRLELRIALAMFIEKHTMVAVNDRQDNDFIDHKHAVFSGQTAIVWKDTDTTGIYNVLLSSDKGYTFGMETNDIIHVFGKLP